MSIYETNSARTERDRELNQKIISGLMSDSPSLVKQAAENTTAFTRKMLMENSFTHRFLPAEPLLPEDITEDINEIKPYKMVPLEPNSRGAVTVQFGTTPNTMIFDSESYRVYINRIVSPRLTMDTMQLMRYRYDIREVLMDKQTKYIELEKDRRFLDGIHFALQTTLTLGALGNGQRTPTQIKRFEGGMTRENLFDGKMIMASTNAHLHPVATLCNEKTWNEFGKLYPDEIGENTAEDIILNGMTERRFLGMDWVVSIKHELIPDGFVYYFASPDYLGKHYVVEDLTMWVKHEAYMLSAFQWTAAGAGIGNISGIALADFNPTGLSDGGSGIYAISQP
jgi:hypothetical protein